MYIYISKFDENTISFSHFSKNINSLVIYGLLYIYYYLLYICIYYLFISTTPFATPFAAPSTQLSATTLLEEPALCMPEVDTAQILGARISADAFANECLCE